MLDELSINELGIGFVYSVMETLAKRYSLRDVIVNLSHESFGDADVPLGGQSGECWTWRRTSAPHRVSTATPTSCRPKSWARCARRASSLSRLHLARFSAAHDPLTNIANRRTFDSALEAAAARSSRYGWAFTLLVIDLNGFKSINDTLGHADR